MSTLSVTQWRIMINNDVLLFSATMQRGKHFKSSSYITGSMDLSLQTVYKSKIYAQWVHLTAENHFIVIIKNS